MLQCRQMNSSQYTVRDCEQVVENRESEQPTLVKMATTKTERGTKEAKKYTYGIEKWPQKKAPLGLNLLRRKFSDRNDHMQKN